MDDGSQTVDRGLLLELDATTQAQFTLEEGNRTLDEFFLPRVDESADRGLRHHHLRHLPPQPNLNPVCGMALFRGAFRSDSRISSMNAVAGPSFGLSRGAASRAGGTALAIASRTEEAHHPRSYRVRRNAHPRFIREHKTRTGETLSFTAFMAAGIGRAVAGFTSGFP